VGKKVVLAYSGGLDTSVAIEWIKDKTGAEVVAVAADVGQGGEDMNVIKQRALDCGAVAAEVLDLREEFANEYCAPALKANALYMDRYPLVSSLSRPIISKYLVEAAKKHDAYMVGHGCTGKGNAYTKNPAEKRDADEVLITFKKGLPTHIDGQAVTMLQAIEIMNKRAGAQGVGRIDMVEDRLVGIKSREVYEAPGAIALITAHQELENVCLERELSRFKRGVEQRWGELVYDGLWFSPLRQALDVFIDETQKHVSGDIRMKLHAGKAVVTGRKSAESLYRYDLATYDSEDTYDQSWAKGFIEIFGMTSKIAADRDRKSK